MIKIYIVLWLFKRLLKKINGRKKKQTGCLENIVWIEGYVTIFWILNVISNIIYHYWITVNAQCHIQSKGHSLHKFFRYTIFFLPTSLNSFIQTMVFTFILWFLSDPYRLLCFRLYAAVSVYTSLPEEHHGTFTDKNLASKILSQKVFSSKSWFIWAFALAHPGS